MDLTTLSKEQLAEAIRSLQDGPDNGAAGVLDELRTTVQELQVHRCELEMQNRTLREMQIEIEHSLQRYADLYDHLPLAYLTVATDGRIMAANRAAEEWLQRDIGGLIGSFIGRFFDAYDAGRLAAHLEMCVQSGQRHTIDLTLRAQSNLAVPVQLSSRVAPHAPDTERQIHVAMTDVSKLKAVQKTLEEINREQEAFNYSISHDLRAPLVTINNYATIVLEEHAPALDVEAKEMVERIRCAAVRMEETLKHLLQYSTLAREEIVLATVNVESVVSDLLIEHRGIIEQKNGIIDVERPLPTVRGCRPILSQVLANLLTNALKYTQPGEPPRVRFSAVENDGKVIIKVIDHGIGIDEKYHERVFRIFERLHGYSRYPGSGVGLAIARRAVERMSGRIWCESSPGKGSCFCLELPKG
jgi:signal transduction histidine kinase